jgi:hypothetical protein
MRGLNIDLKQVTSLTDHMLNFSVINLNVALVTFTLEMEFFIRRSQSEVLFFIYDFLPMKVITKMWNTHIHITLILVNVFNFAGN